MMTLIELIREYCSDLVDDYQQIASRLNEPTIIDNPRAGETDTITTPVQITLKSIMDVVPVAEQLTVYKSIPQLIQDLKAAIDDGDREYMTGLLQIAMADGSLSAGTISALTVLLQATETIETTQPVTIAGPSIAAAAGLGTVTPAQVQAALA